MDDCHCLVKAITRSAVGQLWGVGLTWRLQSGCQHWSRQSDRGGVLVPVMPSPCSALPPPPDRSPVGRSPRGGRWGSAGHRQGRGCRVPYSSRGSAQKAARAGCPHRVMFFLHAFISSPLCSDKYPLSPPGPASVPFRVFLLPAAVMTDEYRGYFVIKSLISFNDSVLLSTSVYIHSLEVGCDAIDQ